MALQSFDRMKILKAFLFIFFFFPDCHLIVITMESDFTFYTIAKSKKKRK